jgi:hypothetical protein
MLKEEDASSLQMEMNYRYRIAGISARRPKKLEIEMEIPNPGT